MNKTFSLQEKFASWVMDLIVQAGVSRASALTVKLVILIVLLGVLVVLIDWISRKAILAVVKQYANNKQSKFLDILVEKKIFKHLGHLIPAIFTKITLPLVLTEFPNVRPYAHILIELTMVIVVLIFLQSTLKALKIILLEIDSLKDKPVASFVQLFGILLS